MFGTLAIDGCYTEAGQATSVLITILLHNGPLLQTIYLPTKGHF